MELRQIKYFVKAVELKSLSRAAAELGLVPSALSQQITKLEGEMSTRLLRRNSTGVEPTKAGSVFYQQAKLALRHLEYGIQSAQELRLTGTVRIGITPTLINIIGIPFITLMDRHYPNVRVNLVEGMSGYLATLLNDKELDHAVLFRYDLDRYWSVSRLIKEQIFLFRKSTSTQHGFQTEPLDISELCAMPLFLASGLHGLRQTLNSLFTDRHVRPFIKAELDSLGVIMQAVEKGHGQTLQPASAAAAYKNEKAYSCFPIADINFYRTGDLCSLPDEDLSAAAIAGRTILIDTFRQVYSEKPWPGMELLIDS